MTRTKSLMAACLAVAVSLGATIAPSAAKESMYHRGSHMQHRGMHSGMMMRHHGRMMHHRMMHRRMMHRM